MRILAAVAFAVLLSALTALPAHSLQCPLGGRDSGDSLDWETTGESALTALPEHSTACPNGDCEPGDSLDWETTGESALTALPAHSNTCTAGCDPGDYPGWDTTGEDEITIRVPSTVKDDQTALAEAQQAITNWNDCAGVAEGSMPRLVLKTAGTADVDIVIGWPQRARDYCSICDATFVPPSGGFGPIIYIKLFLLQDSNIYDHEFGHVLNMASSNSGNCDMSIMWLTHPSFAFVQLCDCINADVHNVTPTEQQQEEEEPCTTGPECPQTPLVFDIDGDRHIPTVSVNSEFAVFFDIDADGVEERVGWLADTSGDAFLWLDLNNNGTVDDGGELFGSSTRLPNGSTVDNGFDALATYDQSEFGGNNDGAITAADDVWPSLRLWFDLNRNGVSESGESSSLAEHEIDAISLRYARNRRADDQGNIHTRNGKYWVPSRQGQGVRQELIEDILFLVGNQQ